MIRLWIGVLGVLVFTGCSTVVTHVGYTYDELTSEEDPVEVYPRVYCGTKFNLEFQSAGSGGNILGLFLLPDLILSAAADTIMLPLTWVHDEIRITSEDTIDADGT